MKDFVFKAVDSTSQTVERVHDDGDLDATDSASVTPTSTLGRSISWSKRGSGR